MTKKKKDIYTSGPLHKSKWYTVEYYDARNGMTYKTPVKAKTKENALNIFGTKSERKYMKKVKVTLFK